MNVVAKQAQYSHTDDVACFLFRPDIECKSVEERLAAFAQAELEAVDLYLISHARAAWIEGKSLHALSMREDSWRSLWPGRIAARLLLSEKERGNASWSEALCTGKGGLKLHRFEVPHAGVVNLVVSAGFLDAELTRSCHPSIAGFRLSCEAPSSDRVHELVGRYSAALSLLERWYKKGFSLFKGSVSAIAPLQANPPLELGKCVSLSIAPAPGVVFLTMIPIILLSETLLHEAAHCRLSAAESLGKLWVSNGALVQSPLRPDPRPIGGLYHQAYVLLWLTRYYRVLREAVQEPIVERNCRQIDKHLDELTIGFNFAIETLRENLQALTPLGTKVLEEMAFTGGVP